MPDALYNANEIREPVALEEEKETGRAEAFSDGVFAIAITLLILDVKVPRSAELEHEVWPPHSWRSGRTISLIRSAFLLS